MTTIQWTDATWNPLVGCSLLSPGCTNCYAMRQAARVEKMNFGLAHYRGLTEASKAGPVWTGKIGIAPDDKLLEPLRWRKPSRVFVNSMSDLFHEAVPINDIDRIFAVMALAKRHTFQPLTKRASRAKRYIEHEDTPQRIARALVRLFVTLKIPNGKTNITDDTWPLDDDAPEDEPTLMTWPLPNVHLGVSVEDQRRAEERIPDLLDTPAAVRWVSAEPLLGAVDFTRLFHSPLEFAQALDWIVIGGESGPGARPFDIAWARDILRQCRDAGVPAFVKQLGAKPIENGKPLRLRDRKGGDIDAWLVPDFNCPLHGERFKREFGPIEAGSIWDNGIDIDRRPSGQPALALCEAYCRAMAMSEPA